MSAHRGRGGPSTPAGLTEAAAAERLAQFGPNELPQAEESRWRDLAHRFWGPLAWMLEVTIVAAAALGRGPDALAITGLLIVNAFVGTVQHGRAQDALALLGSRLQPTARVRRAGSWKTVPARTIVVDDVVRVRAGDAVPADLRLLEGEAEVDQSSLTGESGTVQVGVGGTAYASSTVARGEATGVVAATGAGTVFGRTAELVATAAPPTHLEAIVLSLVRWLMLVDLVLVGVVLATTPVFGLSWAQGLLFALVLLIASVPVALPATFTVAQAFGALELARAGGEGHGALVTRLAAIQEAASMDVLCSDKTGTLTLNRLAVGDVRPYPPVDRAELLRLAALASDTAGGDPIDLALAAAAPGARPDRRLGFVPFDPSTKRTEATVEEAGQVRHLVKGAPSVVADLVRQLPESFDADVDRLAAGGGRVIAIATGNDSTLTPVGVLALTDPPRPDSAALVRALRDLSVEVKMVTGDGIATARAVAAQVDLGARIASRDVLVADPAQAVDYDGFAGVLPEDKYRLVASLQQAGHVVGMTGDGVNDAPALKQAGVGIAVANATDVARRAASIVLTDAGLVNVVTAVRASRVVYRRMTTWMLNKVVKTLQIVVFLTGALVWTREFVITPTLMVLLLFGNDFVTVALGTDRARPTTTPQRWKMRAIMAAALGLTWVALGESFLVLGLARGPLGLDLDQIRTAVFVMLVFSGLATLFVVREHGWFWSSRPSRPLAIAAGLDVLAVGTVARLGILMTPIPAPAIALIGGLAVGFMFLLDPVKRLVLRRFRFL